MGYDVLSRRHPTWIRGALVLALCGLSASVRATTDPPPTVTALEVRTDEPLARRIDLGRLAAFEVGGQLTPAAVRRTLSNAHATGLFAEVELLTRPAAAGVDGAKGGGGVVAVLVLRGYLRLGEVTLQVDGPGGGPGARRARRDLRLREGQILDEDALQESLEGLRRAWLDRGFRDVRIDAELLPTPARNRVDLRVHVEPGRRPRITEVRLDIPAAEDATDARPALLLDARGNLREALPVRAGDAWRPRRLETARQRLRREIAELGYLAAEVDEPQTLFMVPDEAPTSADEAGAAPEVADVAAGEEAVVVFRITPGPRIELEVEGAELGKLRRQHLLPFLDGEPFGEEQLRRVADDLRRHLQGQGHRRASVEVLRLGDGRGAEGERVERWRLSVDRGGRWLVREVEFVGNESIGDDTLRRLIDTGVRRALEPGSGRLVDEQLTADLDALRSFYLLQGYPEVRIEPPRIAFEEPKDSSGTGTLRVRFSIQEGPRQRLVDLFLEGLEALDADQVRTRLTLRPGGPFHPLLVDDSIDILRALYEDEGYRAGTVTPRYDWNDERTLVDVTLDVDEGPKTLIDRLVLRGLVRTRPGVVRAFADLEPGEPLARRDMLRAERDLYRLGVFSRVEVEPSPSGPTPPADGVRRRDVLIDLQEGSLWRLSYGLSFHSDDGIGGLFGVTRNHVAGRAARFQLDLRASENDRRARLVFDDPSLAGRKLPLTWSLFVRDEERPSFSVQEAGAQVALIRDRGRFRWGLVWDYRTVRIDGAPPDPSDLEREDQEVEISSLSPNFFYDRRDDPLNPSRGGSTALQLEYAFPALDADAEFAKAFVQQTWHHRLGRAGGLAWSVRLGAIEPLGHSLPGRETEPASARIPISERFFAGGRTTHRAYERDELGILGRSLGLREDGSVLELGGNGLALANVDYRFPIAGNFGGVLWADAGNVWADWRDADAADLRLGAGVGLRYLSPIGPVRVEVGWKLDRQPYEDAAPVFFLSFGNPF